MSNTFGSFFRCTTFGESHGVALGVVIDGCPPGFVLSLDRIQADLDRRRPGQSILSSPRNEADRVEILSGVSGSKTLGTPLALLIRNQDQISQDYDEIKSIYRPSHADFTTDAKYGIRAAAGGGRASARETVARVAAASIAMQVLEQFKPDLKILAWVEEVAGTKADIPDPESVTRALIEANHLRCPAKNWQQLEKPILEAKRAGDSVGGVIYCQVLNPPIGIGDPVFGKLEASLAKGMLSLPASKGFEIGSGFAGTLLRGSEHNDEFYTDNSGRIRTRTNRSGGIQGGISNGETIYFRTAFKAVATIFRPQNSVDDKGQEVQLKPKAGRHDPCVLPRAVPLVEAMATLVVLDHLIWQNGLKSLSPI